MVFEGSFNFKGRSGQVRKGQVRKGLVRKGQVKTGQVRIGQVRTGQVHYIAITPTCQYTPFSIPHTPTFPATPRGVEKYKRIMNL